MRCQCIPRGRFRIQPNSNESVPVVKSMETSEISSHLIFAGYATGRLWYCVMLTKTKIGSKRDRNLHFFIFKLMQSQYTAGLYEYTLCPIKNHTKFFFHTSSIIIS